MMAALSAVEPPLTSTSSPEATLAIVEAPPAAGAKVQCWLAPSLTVHWISAVPALFDAPGSSSAFPLRRLTSLNVVLTVAFGVTVVEPPEPMVTAWLQVPAFTVVVAPGLPWIVADVTRPPLQEMSTVNAPRAGTPVMLPEADQADGVAGSSSISPGRE